MRWAWTAPARPRADTDCSRHYRIAPWTDLVEVHWSRHGEAYVTPVGGRLVGVAVLSRHRRSHEQHLSAFPALARRLGGLEAGPVRGSRPAAPQREHAESRTGPAGR